MKKSKKILSLTMALTMAVTSLTACGPKKASLGEDDESQEYTITWYYMANKKPDEKAVEAKVNEYLLDKINAKIDLVPLEWGEYSKKLDNALNAGEKLDLFNTSGSDYINKAYKDILMDITELMPKYAPKTTEMLGEDFINGAKINKKLYGVQANKEHGVYPMLVYRKDITDKYNINVPAEVSSWDELMPVFEEVKKNEPDMYAFAMGANRSPWSTRADVERFGQYASASLLAFVDNGDTLVNVFETEQFKDSCRTAREMYQAGYIYKDVATQDKVSDLISQGKAFSRIESGHPSKIDELNSNEKKFEWAGVRLADPVKNAEGALGSLTVIPYSCENPIRVMKFLELFNTDAYLRNLINFGIEGVNYNKIDDNTIEMIKDSDYGDPTMQWVMGNTLDNYVLKNESTEKYDKIKAFNEEMATSKYMGFNPDFSSLNSEMTACKNVTAKYQKILEYGVEDFDEYIGKLNAELKASGIDKIREEIQRQYDEWKN